MVDERGALFFLAGCTSAALTTPGPKQPSRGEQCEFQILTAPPAGGFVELGTVDVTRGSRRLANFKSEIEPSVCQAGGDAAVAWANGHGQYIKATIRKFTGASAAAQAAAPAPATGCQFDTQCKGDRVCLKGECVEPSKK